MELPTYTNIWKIEKRLYKLYDFRLPMPLPVGQVAAFLAIAVPYTLILTMAGMPFSHTFLWLYILPPGVLAWLVTRPVLEGKRLPELLLSQLRYLSEPRTWCRMAPFTEKDEITLVARVWRLAPAAQPAGTATPAKPLTDATHGTDTRPASSAANPAAGTAAEPAGSLAGAQQDSAAPEPARPVWPSRPSMAAQAELPVPGSVASPAGAAVDATRPATPPATPPVQPSAAAEAAKRAVLRVRAEGSGDRPLRVVERALRSSPDTRADPWRDPVVVVPGGHRPGKPDQIQRDQARARLPLPRAARIVMLGCTTGAGQTMTTLLTGHMLATLRGEAVAVLDLNPGRGGLTDRARAIPRLLPSQPGAARSAAPSRGRGTAPAAGRERGLQVVTADDQAAEPQDAGQLIDTVAARYPLMLADPAAAHVPKALDVADQLVIVAPSSQDAQAALAMTFEWLDANGYTSLAKAAVTVLNGVHAGTNQHADKAAATAAGRCRAIVRIAWDDSLATGGRLGYATIHAYTALAGVLVCGLADPALSGSARR